MKKILTFVVAALLAVPAHVIAQETSVIGKSNIKLNSRMMTPEALWAMGRIGGMEASADGSRIVYQVGYYSVKQNKSHQVICIMDADGKNQRQLTTSSKSETDPTWFDAEHIAFISGGELWTMKADGSERHQMTKTNGEVEGYKFSPDRKKVIILKSLPFHEIIKKNPDDLPKATGRRVTDLMYRHWDHYVESIQHPFVCSVSSDGIATNATDILEGEPYECPMEPFGGIEQLAWSNDSKQIAYTCRKKTGLEYSISTDSDIYLYNIETKTTRNLCKPADYKAPAYDATRTLKIQAVNAPENLKNNVGYDQNPQFSPDGKYIAWLSMERDGYEADLNRLCIYSLENGEKSYIDWKSDIDAFCWAPQKDKLAKLYFISVWNGCCNMYYVDSKKEVKQLTEDWADWTSLQLANDGKHILATRQSLSAPTDIYRVTPAKSVEKTKIEQLSFENKHILDQLTFGKMQQRWVSTTDGKQMLVWVMLPANYEEGKKYPTLLFCEGGPQSPVSQFWSYRWNFQIMAANGYVVIAPNRHGLPGFGQEWKEQISGDWTGQCMSDYLAAIDDAAQNLPFVDKDRLAAVGASFGGFSVYYLAGIHEKRFKAFIAHDGAFNLEAMYTETEENWFSNWEYDEAYWHHPQMPNAKKTYENSPHKMVEKWDTPILCIHGEKDYRINATQGMSAFNAARMKGIPAELLIFPDENHWVLKPQNGVLWQRTFFDWLDRWLK
ncbi:Dipeptidyl aminopeptidase/acylaminoacyl peptidase [Prevotellaceae bacterium HUN156]|nr:Dipeptidyl aminopeptidase/acylaminoacyl peptidase [Prevotellaceae bacterium HUN156]